jgi:hypothetical protein
MTTWGIKLMKLEKKVYTTRAEKQKDLFIGVGIFLGVNVLLFMIAVLVATLVPRGRSGFEGQIFGLIPILFNCLPYLANVGLAIYFALTRSWIALGMILTLGILSLIGLLVGVIAGIVCFIALLGSGIP